MRQIGVAPPKWHDAGDAILAFSERLPEEVRLHARPLAAISKWLRKERRFSFCGDIDFIPTEEYGRNNAVSAITDAEFDCNAAVKVIPA